MDSKKLSLSNYVFVGSMLFGLFFGAGNLIFPVEMGQNAGGATLITNFGFLLTAVGMPFLGILAMGVTNSSGIQALASKVGRKYANVFTILLYATIGPFFALPRLAATAFTIGIEPFIANNNSKLFLLIFSILFFGIAYLFARNPSRLLDYVGKFLNPIFLIFLAVLIVAAFLHPLGTITQGKIAAAYANSPFLQGLTNGYNTMDVLASLAFGVVVISTLKNLGLNKPRDIAAGTFKSGIVVVVLMAIIYTLLSLMGAMSIGHFKVASNGGVALAQIANYYLKTYGSVLLSAIVIFATLKTTIGLITSIGEAAVQFNEKISYRWAIVVITVLPTIFANVGLNQIIKFSVPILSFLYPLAIVLIILALLETLIGYRKSVYVVTTIFAGLSAIFDVLNATGDTIKKLALVESLLKWVGNYLPLFSSGLGWVVPSLLGFIIGLIISFVKTSDE